MTDRHLGRVRAEVTSAAPLSNAQLKDVEAALAKATGKKIMLQTRHDPEMIGGVIARVGDLVFDGSVRTRLENLKNEMLN